MVIITVWVLREHKQQRNPQYHVTFSDYKSFKSNFTATYETEVSTVVLKFMTLCSFISIPKMESTSWILWRNDTYSQTSNFTSCENEKTKYSMNLYSHCTQKGDIVKRLSNLAWFLFLVPMYLNIRTGLNGRCVLWCEKDELVVCFLLGMGQK